MGPSSFAFGGRPIGSGCAQVTPCDPEEQPKPQFEQSEIGHGKAFSVWSAWAMGAARPYWIVQPRTDSSR
jgi:hypothetical protein